MSVCVSVTACLSVGVCVYVCKCRSVCVYVWECVCVYACVRVHRQLSPCNKPGNTLSVLAVWLKGDSEEREKRRWCVCVYVCWRERENRYNMQV